MTNIIEIPNAIILPLLFEKIENTDISTILNKLHGIFGFKHVYFLDDLITYLISIDHMYILSWILKDHIRLKKYFCTYYRQLLLNMSKSADPGTIAHNFVETLCRADMWDLYGCVTNRELKKYIDGEFEYSMAAKHGKIEHLLSIININDFDKVINAFYTALFEYQSSVYITLYSLAPHFIIGHINLEHFDHAQTMDNQEPLRFLLMIDPRVWHVSSKTKIVCERRYFLKTSLEKEFCVSSHQYFANYT